MSEWTYFLLIFVYIFVDFILINTITISRQSHILSIVVFVNGNSIDWMNAISPTTAKPKINKNGGRKITAVDWYVIHSQPHCGETRSLNTGGNASLPSPSTQHSVPAIDSWKLLTDRGYKCMSCQPVSHPAHLAHTNDMLIDFSHFQSTFSAHLWSFF